MSVARSRTLIATAAAVGAIGLSAMGASAAPANGGTEHSSFDAAGSVFVCSGPTGNITAMSGTVNQVIHFNVDGQGVFHITGTITTSGVTLQDANGDWYTLSGAAWFGGKAPADQEQPIVSTDTEHFVLHNTTSGGIVKVQMVTHTSPNGDTFTFDRGSCESPAG